MAYVDILAKIKLRESYILPSPDRTRWNINSMQVSHKEKQKQSSYLGRTAWL